MITVTVLYKQNTIAHHGSIEDTYRWMAGFVPNDPAEYTFIIFTIPPIALDVVKFHTITMAALLQMAIEATGDTLGDGYLRN